MNIEQICYLLYNSDDNISYKIMYRFNELRHFCLYEYLFENLGPQEI